MELTLDGLVKALRLAAHGLAEDAEAGYVLDEGLMGSQAPSSFDGLRMRATDLSSHDDRPFDRFRMRDWE